MSVTTIREAVPADFDTLARLYSELDAYHAAVHPDLFRVPDPTAARPDAYYQELLDSPLCRLLVAEVDGQVVGFVSFRLDYSPELPNCLPYTYVKVSDLEVTPAFRRRGLGRRLMQAAEDWARKKGAVSLVLNVFDFNENARELYRALGYHELSHRMRKKLE